jgi:ribonucleoside-triphosphate reductase
MIIANQDKMQGEMKMKVIKRSGKEVNYDRSKIENAIINANNSVDDKRYQLKQSQITKITDNVILECEKLGRAVHVEEIQDMVEEAIMKSNS